MYVFHINAEIINIMCCCKRQMLELLELAFTCEWRIFSTQVSSRNRMKCPQKQLNEFRFKQCECHPILRFQYYCTIGHVTELRTYLISICAIIYFVLARCLWASVCCIYVGASMHAIALQSQMTKICKFRCCMLRIDHVQNAIRQTPFAPMR